MTLEQVEAFLTDYEVVCRKHGLFVHACGCCGSPWVDDGNLSAMSIEEHVEHLRDYASQEEGGK